MSFSTDEISGVHLFLRSTPESHLKNLLVQGKFSEDHFRLLVKFAKTCSEADFAVGLQSESFPGIRLKPNDIKIREHFWSHSKSRLVELGLLSSSGASKAA